MLLAGCYVFFARKNLSCKIIDPLKRNRTEKSLKFGGIALIICSLLLAVASFFAEKEQLQEAADAINAIVPKMIDAETRLDGAVVGEGKSLIYNLTLISVKVEEIDRELWEKEVVPAIRANMLKSPNTAKLQNENITIIARYQDSAGKLVDEIIIKPSE